MARTTSQPEETMAQVADRCSYIARKRKAELGGREHVGPTGKPHGLPPQPGRLTEIVQMLWDNTPSTAVRGATQVSPVH